MRGQMRVNPICSNCKTKETPLWRKGPNNTYNCNACGLYYRIYKKDRPFQHKSVTYRHRKRLKKGCEEDEENVTNSTVSEEASSTALKQNNVLEHEGFYENEKDDKVGWKEFVDMEKLSKNKELNGRIDIFFGTHDEENKNTVKRKHYMAKVKETKAERKLEQNKAGRVDGPDGLKGAIKSVAHLKGEALGAHTGKGRYPYGYPEDAYEKALVPCNFNVYPPARCFKAPPSRFSAYLEDERGIQFPEIKLVPKNTARLETRERKHILSEEEMEAAEALADFAYYARHRE